jgi:hypothetical protein
MFFQVFFESFLSQTDHLTVFPRQKKSLHHRPMEISTLLEVYTSGVFLGRRNMVGIYNKRP